MTNGIDWDSLKELPPTGPRKRNAGVPADAQSDAPSIKLDPTVARIMSESADRHGVTVGYLRRFVTEEAGKAHLARRHGLFENLRQLVRHEADRQQAAAEGSATEDAPAP